jgi:hypothetical protein
MLNAKKLALSGAIVWSIFSFLFVAFVLLTGSGLGFINSMLSSFFSSYRLNWTGALVVLVAAFIDGFIFFYLLAIIYNRLNKEDKKIESLYSNEE